MHAPILPQTPLPSRLPRDAEQSPTIQQWRPGLFLSASSVTPSGSSVSHAVVCDSLRPRGLQPPRLLCPWNPPGKNTGVGCHFLLQGIFPTQGSNPGLLHCRQILYRLSYWEALVPLHLCNKEPRLALFPKNISEVCAKAKTMCPPPETRNFQRISNVNTPVTNLHEEGGSPAGTLPPALCARLCCQMKTVTHPLPLPG